MAALTDSTPAARSTGAAVSDALPLRSASTRILTSARAERFPLVTGADPSDSVASPFGLDADAIVGSDAGVRAAAPPVTVPRALEIVSEGGAAAAALSSACSAGEATRRAPAGEASAVRAAGIAVIASRVAVAAALGGPTAALAGSAPLPMRSNADVDGASTLASRDGAGTGTPRASTVPPPAPLAPAFVDAATSLASNPAGVAGTAFIVLDGALTAMRDDSWPARAVAAMGADTASGEVGATLARAFIGTALADVPGRASWVAESDAGDAGNAGISACVASSAAWGSSPGAATARCTVASGPAT